MDVEVDCDLGESYKTSTMENIPKPKKGGKVKLKIVKKKVNIRHPRGMNRSNSSFNTSLNGSMRMKQTLRSNNRALAHALQFTKQDLALATDLISSLKMDNRNLMLETARNKYATSQYAEDQVNEKLKSVLMIFKQKIREVSNRLVDVASIMKDLSVTVSAHLLSPSATSSRSGSMEVSQNIPETASKVFSSARDQPTKGCSEVAPKVTATVQSFNDLSLIAETSFTNVEEFATHTVEMLSTVMEVESEKTDNKGTICKPPQRVSVGECSSLSKSGNNGRRRSSNSLRRQSMNEIDFGTSTVTSRKKRRSSFMLPSGLDKALRINIGIALTETDIQNSSIEEHPLENSTVEEDSNSTSVKNDFKSSNCVIEEDLQSLTVDTSNHQVLEPKVSADFNSKIDVAPEEEHPVKPGTETKATPLTETPALQSDDIITNYTLHNEVDMELTQVINATVQINPESSDAQINVTLKDADNPLAKEVLPTKSDTTIEAAVVASTVNNAEDATIVKALKVVQKKNTQKGDKKNSKQKPEEKPIENKEMGCEDDNKAVVELRLTKPGKYVFSTTRKNSSGVRPSPPQARSRKKTTEMKKDGIAAEPKTLFDFHDKTPQLLAKKPDPKDTGVYDVSLNDSVYGKCQSLGQYREKVALAKEKAETVKSDCSTELSMPSPDKPSPPCARPMKTTSVEDTTKVGVEEKKKPSRSKKKIPAENNGYVDIKKKSRSRKRAVESDEEGEQDYERLYTKTPTSALECDMKRRARSKVVNYVEKEESDFDITLIEKATPKPKFLTNDDGKEHKKECCLIVPEVLGNAVIETKQKPKIRQSLYGKMTNPYGDSTVALNQERSSIVLDGISSEDKDKTCSTGRKSQSQLSVFKDTTVQEDSGETHDTLACSEKENTSTKPKGSILRDLQLVIDNMERVQKRSRSEQKRADDEDEIKQKFLDDPQKPKSSVGDIFERYKKALSNDETSNEEVPQRESRLRSQLQDGHVANELVESEEDKTQTFKGRSRSVSTINKKVYTENFPEDNDLETKNDHRSTTLKRHHCSVVHKSEMATSSSSLGGKPEESPESKGKTMERGRSRSRKQKIFPDSEDIGGRSVSRKQKSSANSEDIRGRSVSRKQKSSADSEDIRGRSVSRKQKSSADSEDIRGRSVSRKQNSSANSEDIRGRSVSRKQKSSADSENMSQESKTFEIPKLFESPEASKAMERGRSVSRKQKSSADSEDIRGRSVSRKQKSSAYSEDIRGRSVSRKQKSSADSEDIRGRSVSRKQKCSANSENMSQESKTFETPKLFESPEASKAKITRGRGRPKTLSLKISSKVTGDEKNFESKSSEQQKLEQSPEVLESKPTQRGRSRPKNYAESLEISKTIIMKERGRSKTRKQKTCEDESENIISPRRGRSKSRVSKSRSKTASKEMTSVHTNFEKSTELKSTSDIGKTDRIVNSHTMNATGEEDPSEIPLQTKKKVPISQTNQNTESLESVLPSVKPVTPVTTTDIDTVSTKCPGKRLSEDIYDENQDAKRPRRVLKALSYKEPSMVTKLRQGDKLSGNIPVHRISSGLEPAKPFGEEPRKRSTLENLTNIHS